MRVLYLLSLHPLIGNKVIFGHKRGFELFDCVVSSVPLGLKLPCLLRHLLKFIDEAVSVFVHRFHLLLSPRQLELERDNSFLICCQLRTLLGVLLAEPVVGSISLLKLRPENLQLGALLVTDDLECV